MTTPRKGSPRIRQRRAPAGGRPGLWEARFSFVDAAAPGGRRWVSVYGPTKADVEAKLVDGMAAKSRGLEPPRGTLTVGAYLTDWIAQTGGDLKLSTATAYGSLLRLQVIPRIGHHRLTRLTPAHVNAMTASMMEAGLKPATANHARAVVRNALNDAMRQGLVIRNAAALADRRRVEELVIQPMSPEEARAILDVVAGHRVGPLVTTALWTGLRLGELLALTWDRVDLDGRTLRVTESLSRVRRETHVWATKNRSSTRTVPVPAPLVSVLSDHKRRQRELRRAAGDEWDGSWGDLVFTRPTGEPLNGTTASSEFKALLRAGGLPQRRFHDLRHAAATLWLAAGVDLKTVSSLLGHSTIAVTANIYTGVLDTLRTDAADKMTRLLAAPSPDARRRDS